MSEIAGFASIEYRLSAHPDFAHDVNSPTVMHADDILDVAVHFAFFNKSVRLGTIAS